MKRDDGMVEDDRVAKAKDSTRTVKVRVDPELYERLMTESRTLDGDVSTYVWWCIQTGLYLKDLNTYVRSKSKEEEY